MFISEEEARRRLRSEDNLLTRLRIPSDTPELSSIPKSDVADQVDAALEETANNPTPPSEDDAVRLAVLAGRRHLRLSEHRGGRYPQQGNVPPIFRSLIASSARMGTIHGTARAWGVSDFSTLHYKQGRIGPTYDPDPDLLSQIERNTLGIRNQVLGVLAQTVAGITPESLENKDAKELSIIARNLSAIMTGTRPPADIGDKTTNAQVIVFSPEQDKEESYPTTEVG